MQSSTYKYWHLFWLIPLFFLGLTIHQAFVYQGIKNTYKNGTSYTAEVLQFETKQIVSQTSSYVVIQFQTKQGNTFRRKMSLPVEIAGNVSKSRILPIRYHPPSFQEIIIIPAYDEQTTITLVNIAMAAFALLVTSILGWGVSRWIRTRTQEDPPQKIIIDNIKTAEH